MGLGTAAFTAFIARATDPRYTATQFALFTSLAAVPRTIVNASTGWIVEATGWFTFFLLCTALALPGMALLLRVAPWNESECGSDAKPGACRLRADIGTVERYGSAPRSFSSASVSSSHSASSRASCHARSPCRASFAFSSSLVGVGIGVGRREPRVERRLFGAERVELALDLRELGWRAACAARTRAGATRPRRASAPCDRVRRGVSSAAAASRRRATPRRRWPSTQSR